MKNIFKNIKNWNILRALNLQRFDKPAILIGAMIAFIVINAILSPFSMREDLSQGKAYTLSPATKKIIQNTKNTVDIQFFASSDIPSRLLPLKNDVVDLLNEYSRQSRNIRVQTLDPKRSEDALKQAKEAGIPELQFSQLEQDKYAVTASYFGMLIRNGDKKEIIPQVTDIESLEYNITAVLYKLTQNKLGSVGVINPEEILGMGQPNSLQTLGAILGQQFNVETVPLATASGDLQISNSYDSLLIFNPINREFSEDEVNAIEAYIKNKGKAIFFVDGVWVTDDLITQPAQTNLEPLFDQYGIVISKDLILSANSEFVNFGNQQVSYMVQYPFWIKTNNFNTQTSYFSNVNQLTYPWTSSISVKKKNGVETKELVKTTKDSWNQTSDFTLNPQSIQEPKQENLKEFTVTVESKKNNEGQMTVISSSRFAQDRFISRGSNNIEFILNILNDYASGGALSGIRQRAVNFYPLPVLTESQKDIFKYANILLLPALFGLYGAWRILKRK